MTTPVKPEPISRVLTGDEWEAAQYAPHRLTSDPKKPLPPGRVLTGDEWEQAQRSGSLRKQTFPAMPKFAADATRRLNPNSGEQDRTPTEYLGDAIREYASDIEHAPSLMPGTRGVQQLAGILGRQIVAPIVEHPIMTAAMMNPVGAVAGGMMAAHTVAKYGWQVAHESKMTPEERAEAQRDPNRVEGEAAAVQAIMLGLGSLAGVKALRSLGDVSAGVMEAGARGVRETDFGLTAEAGDAAQTANLRAQVTESAKRYFETEKGAEVLGTTAGAHGLPETASPFPPASALDVAWKEGHSAARPKAPPVERIKAVAILTHDGRVVEGDIHIHAAQKAGMDPGRVGVDYTDGYTTTTGRFVGREEAMDIADRAEQYVDETAKRETKREGVLDSESITPAGQDWGVYDNEGNRVAGFATEAEALEAADEVGLPKGSVRQTNVAPSVTPKAAPTANMAGPGEPGYKGPAALYGRLSDDALATEYRALLEKRTTEEPGAQAPLWDVEREARAVEQIENRRRPDGSLSPADKKRLDYLQAAQGEEYGVGRHTFESAAAERRLNEINKHITAIEKEIGNRGQNPVDLMQAPSQGGGGLTPIEGTGETVQRGLSRSTTKGLADTRRAIEDDLSSTLGDLPEYRRLNMKDQATKAMDFLERDPEAARRVALGDEAAPEGLQPEAVFVAMRNQARREGDVATLLDLAHGGLTEQATTMGQRIRILGERDPEDPVYAMQSVMDKRSGGKGAEKAIASTVKEIEQAGLANLDSLLDFFESVKC